MKELFGRYFILILILFALIGCQNPLERSGQESSLGTGSFSLVLDTADTERSVVPGTSLNSFAVFTLEFFASGTANLIYTEDRLPAALSGAISLPGGTMDLSVTAYLDLAKTKPAAWGKLAGIVIKQGEKTTGSVMLAAVNDAGSGTFAWNINYPATVNYGKMAFTRIAGSTETPTGTNYFTGGTPKVDKTGSLSLNSGYYRVVFHLHSNDGKIAERSEILHIYRNLASSFSFNFVANDFHFDRVKQVNFEGGATTAVVDFCNLSNNTIYLVKVNTSGNIISAGNTGGAVVKSPELTVSGNNKTPPPALETLRSGHPGADLSNANPPPISDAMKRNLPRKRMESSLNETKSFWVDGYTTSAWEKPEATLLAQGTHGNIWVVGTDINIDEAKALAAKFDIIYPAVTNILGYEFGGGSNGSGGKDGQTKVQILVYNTYDTNLAGFFWNKDFYPDDTHSNNAEIFYINARVVREKPDFIYSTLAHEFQHMIHFNKKQVEKGLLSDTWYNEMLSLMTEDVMSSLLGIPLSNNQNKIMQRIPFFLSGYDVGLTNWSGLPENYGHEYAFGAYLLRNFGGAELLKRIMANDTVNEPSISAELNEMVAGMDLKKALKRFGETLIFTGQDGYMTFNKTVTKTINGTTYTSLAFDVWNTFKIYASPYNQPNIYDLTQKEMKPNSILLHSADVWSNKTGDFSINVQKPDTDVTLYLMAR